jgi:hypothetical protein
MEEFQNRQPQVLQIGCLVIKYLLNGYHHEMMFANKRPFYLSVHSPMGCLGQHFLDW